MITPVSSVGICVGGDIFSGNLFSLPWITFCQLGLCGLFEVCQCHTLLGHFAKIERLKAPIIPVGLLFMKHRIDFKIEAADGAIAKDRIPDSMWTSKSPGQATTIVDAIWKRR